MTMVFVWDDKKVRTKKLLEIGVAEGGTTAVIMEAMWEKVGKCKT